MCNKQYAIKHSNPYDLNSVATVDRNFTYPFSPELGSLRPNTEIKVKQNSQLKPKSNKDK